MADNLGDDPFTRFVNFLVLATETLLTSYQWVVIVIAAIFFLIVGGLLLVFR